MVIVAVLTDNITILYIALCVLRQQTKQGSCPDRSS
jgi:hypothetical protein